MASEDQNGEEPIDLLRGRSAVILNGVALGLMAAGLRIEKSHPLNSHNIPVTLCIEAWGFIFFVNLFNKMTNLFNNQVK